MARRHARSGASALALAVGLSGCTLGPDFSVPDSWSPTAWFDHAAQPEAPTPQDASRPVAAPLNVAWWDSFDDPELSALEQRVAASNLDVKAATARLEQSRSARRVIGSKELPSVDGNASYRRELSSENGITSLLGAGGDPANAAGVANGTGFGATGLPGANSGAAKKTGTKQFDLWQFGFDASWEVDLWGHVAREVESADASVGASAEDRRDVLLTVLAEVARDYVHLRGVQANLAIARSNLDTARQARELTERRAASGAAGQLDVANASAEEQSISAEIPALANDETVDVNRLSFLVGAEPGALRQELATAAPIPPVPARVPLGFPSELVRRRPDIRAAEARLHAATADIGVAIADFYPRLTLSGSAGLQALSFKNLGNWGSQQFAVGPSLSVPIFEGGRLQGTLDLRKAEQQEAAIAYQKTVLQAWHDVDNAIAAYEAEQARRARLVGVVAQDQRALDLARQNYVQGAADFLRVLDAQRELLAAQQQLTVSTTSVSTDLVAMYKSLGGGWEETFPSSPAAEVATRPD